MAGTRLRDERKTIVCRCLDSQLRCRMLGVNGSHTSVGGSRRDVSRHLSRQQQAGDLRCPAPLPARLEPQRNRRRVRMVGHCLGGALQPLPPDLEDRRSRASGWDAEAEPPAGTRIERPVRPDQPLCRSALLEWADDTQEYFEASLLYTLWNPARARVEQHPGETNWSSFRATVGLDWTPKALDTTELLRYFGSTPAAALDHFTRWVEAGRRQALRCWADRDSEVR